MNRPSSDQPGLREKLKRMAYARDRGDPYCFVGREQERREMLAHAELCPPRGSPGCTVLITGAPGAGKTALLRQAAAEMQDEGQPKTAIIELRSLQDPDQAGALGLMCAVAHRLASAADPAAPEVKHHLSGGIGLAGARAGRSRTKDALGNPRSFEDVADSVAADADGKPSFAPHQRVVLAIDEVQNIVKGSWAASVLLQAHTQERLPVAVLCAGLSDAKRALDAAGLSRLSQGLTLQLGRLSQDEATDCVVRTLSELVDEHGLIADGTSISRCAHRMAQDSDGWPKHLHTYMREMFGALSQAPAPITHIDMDLDAVMGRGGEARLEYYKDRLEAGSTPAFIVNRLLEASALRPIEAEDAESVLYNAAEELRRLDPGRLVNWDETFRGNPGRCFQELLHAGLVATDKKGFCHCPIPTLASHVAMKAQETTRAM